MGAKMEKHSCLCYTVAKMTKQLETIILGLIGAIVFVGCVTAPGLESQLSQFERANEDEITQRLGPPDSIGMDDKGQRILTYGKRGVGVYPDCVVNFVINGRRSVAEWNWNGRHCQAFEDERFGTIDPQRAVD